MLRTFVCAVVALLLVVGVSVAEKKGKGKKPRVKPTAVGKFVKFEKGKDEGTLTITLHKRKKKGEEAEKGEDKTFTVANGTPVHIFKGEGKPEKATSPEAFEGVKPGTHTRVFTDEGGKVTRVGLGGHRKGGKKDKRKDKSEEKKDKEQ